ncbi:4-hydroxy-tetrahydrodipicolinate synthase [Candidatus Gromoviella agglomerans]|uniref:4-hydroxy-tetrahydrodipicolinate synthase n=1 Tax=Candidatus Gromoviella agglomerans TaxID=2806609 RepID=UPI001E4E79A5|nr:4-hydroxy-tetrahydrodipicolinate synthase [Candidatus Gromoviella agglomerans]UFX98178.1 4-hydroxy-tetrahydrodipicolinate synthase [Candidatus Gromoviella agglomerans]
MRLITALITPFINDNEICPSIDYESTSKILKEQFDSGVRDILVMGSTGEGSALLFSERKEFLSFVINKSREYEKQNKVNLNVIACVNANVTSIAIEQAKDAKTCGANQIMITSPCYNKPTEIGLYKHFSFIASQIDLPIILYNVPSRTSINIPIHMIKQLFDENSNIIGIKDATSDISRIHEILFLFREKVFAGDDESILTFGFEGAGGIISVISNLLIREMLQICSAIQEHDTKKAIDEYRKIYKIISNTSKITNPIGIKTEMSKKYSYIKNCMRLPLCAD